MKQNVGIFYTVRNMIKCQISKQYKRQWVSNNLVPSVIKDVSEFKALQKRKTKRELLMKSGGCL